MTSGQADVNRSSVPGRCRDHGGLDVGDAAEGDGLGATDPRDGDGLGAGEVPDVGEWLGCGV
jgi:hypothetical protein